MKKNSAFLMPQESSNIALQTLYRKSKLLRIEDNTRTYIVYVRIGKALPRFENIIYVYPCWGQMIFSLSTKQIFVKIMDELLDIMYQVRTLHFTKIKLQLHAWVAVFNTLLCISLCGHIIFEDLCLYDMLSFFIIWRYNNL
jgi:hypothetical protein